MKRQYVKYSDIKPYINEADILLFRGQGWVSSLIGAAGETEYTHVGLASWINGDSNTLDGILECVEFREGSPFAGKNGRGGGRSVNLEVTVKSYPGLIDVYRPIPSYIDIFFNLENKKEIVSRVDFNGKAITRTMRKMTGLPYGWRRILWIAKHKIFRIAPKLVGRDYIKNLMADDLNDVIYPVCSTTVAYAFNKNRSDLIKNRADEWTEPGDIAQSARLNYLFTLIPDNDNEDNYK